MHETNSPAGIGSIVGIAVCNTLVDRIYMRIRKTRSEQGVYPEGRLPLTIVGAFCLPICVIVYGFVPEMEWSFWFLLLSVVVTGFFEILCMVPMLTWVADAFGLYSASAMTAVLVTRCLMGTFLPLATAPLTEVLGSGYGFLILAGVCFGLAPIPLIVMRYGARWRQYSKYTKNDEVTE